MNCNDQNFFYPRFEPNQVLSSARLNEIVESLDKQGRLTRSKLIGTGIACGLQFSWESSLIYIYKGMGISSDGYLLNFCEGDENRKSYSSYRAYNDPDQLNSPWFYDAGSGNMQQIPLFQLTNSGSDTALSLFPNGGGINPFTNYVLILYLQRQTILSDTCSDTCSHTGAEVGYSVIPLIANKSDLETWLGVTSQSIYEDATVQKIRSKRFVNYQQLTTVDSVADITNAYNSILLDSPSATSLLDALADRIEDALATYDKLIAPTLNEQFSTFPGVITDLRNFTSTSKYVQYAYDFVNDLIAAYNEFVDMAYYLAPGCCIDCEAHIRYVMLGQLNNGQNAAFTDFRHFFRHAPTFDRFDERHIRLRQLFHKIIRLIQGYTEVPPATTQGEAPLIRITPSRFWPEEVSKTAIPYYYSNAFPEILRFWDPEKAIKGKFDENLSFYAGTPGKYFGSPKDFVVNPLKYNINDYPFFRVEGHLDFDAQVVYDQLEAAIATNNLPIGLVAVSAQLNPSGSVASLCNTEVYDALYNPDKAEMVALIDTVVLFLTNFDAGCYGRLYDTRIPFIPPTPGYTAENQFTGQLIPNDPTTYINDLITALNALKATLSPSALSGFNYNTFITAFNTALSKAISLRAKVQKLVHDLAYDRVYRYSSPAYFSITFMLSELLTYLNRFILDFTYRRLAYLSLRFANLKANLIKNSSLAKFAEKNPGMEHLGGVSKGGTFVVVYDDAARQGTFGTIAGKVVADFMLPGSCCLDCEMPHDLQPNTTPVVVPVNLNVHAGEHYEVDLWPDSVDPNDYYLSTAGVSCAFSDAVMTVDTSDTTRLRVKIDTNSTSTFIGGQKGGVLLYDHGVPKEIPIHIEFRPVACLPFLFAKDLYVVTAKGVPLNVMVLGYELFGDSTNLSLPNITSVSGASLQLGNPGTGSERYIIYTPSANFTGLDQFYYRLTRSGMTAQGTVTVLVAPCCGEAPPPPPPPPIGDTDSQFLMGDEFSAFTRNGLTWVSPVEVRLEKLLLGIVDASTGKSAKITAPVQVSVMINDLQIFTTQVATNNPSATYELNATLSPSSVLRVLTSAPVSFYNVGLPTSSEYRKTIHVTTIDAMGKPMEELWVLNAALGVFASLDGGYSWSLKSMGLPAAETFTNIFYNPTSPQYVFVTAGSNKLYRTSPPNQGNNWELKNTGILEGGTLTEVVSHQTAFYVAQKGLATGPGVYRSTDGENWTEFGAGLGDINVHSLASDGGRLFAGTEDGLFLYDPITLQWERVADFLDGFVINCIIIHEFNTFSISGPNIGVWITGDAGETWTSLNNGLHMDTGNLVHAHTKGDGETDSYLMASTSQGLFVANGGIAWTKAADPEIVNVRHTLVDPSTWLVTTNNGVFHTTNNGTNFNQGQNLKVTFLTKKPNQPVPPTPPPPMP